MRLLLPVIAALALIPAASSNAQGPPQTVQLTKIDVVKVASGYRVSKIIDKSVVNDANETIGKVDEVILGSDGSSAFVVLSVGGFLGVGTKLIALPYNTLKIQTDKIIIPGATKDSLKALPEFKYASN